MSAFVYPHILPPPPADGEAMQQCVLMGAVSACVSGRYLYLV
jgi:hypothetical protein